MHPWVEARAPIAAWDTSTVVLRLIETSRSSASAVSASIPVGGQSAGHVDHHIELAEMPEGRFDGERGDVGLREITALGRASTPAAANSRTRSATPTALRSHATIRAPAFPKPSATALPIWPARPTPVTGSFR